jgi:putative sugar O-methyltransferase
MHDKYGPSRLRARHDRIHATDEAVTEISSFKAKPINFKIGFWNPEVNGTRYLKALMYNLAADFSDENWKRLRRIENRDIGDPITITYDGEQVCMDYLLSVLELGFIAGNVELDGSRVLEIGAGYGRTCHTVLSNHDLREYHIIDLPSSLKLSSGYLRSVLPEEQFARIHFTPIDEVDTRYADSAFDVSLNINSFAEMNEGTIDAYLALIDAHSDYFYIRDPVGKYLDGSLDGHAEGREIVEMALSTGKLRDVIDIHDNRAIAARRPDFVDAYRPGLRWTCVADGWFRPWSYYWQALYGKDQAEQLTLGAQADDELRP